MSQNVIVGAEGLEEVKRMLDRLPQNARYGAALGINRTVDEAQQAIRDSLPGKFTLRRAAFIRNTVYRKPGQDFATKEKLEGAVRINEERNVLAKYEDGGSKRPRQGGYLAVPVAARPTKGAVVPDRFRLKTLLFASQGRLAQAKSILNSRSGARRRRLLSRSVADDVFIKDGKVWLAQGKGRSRRMTLMWVFKKATWLPKSLGFVATGSRVMNQRAVANVSGAIEVELSRGLTTRSGPRA